MNVVKKYLFLFMIIISGIGLVTNTHASDVNTAKYKADRLERDYKQFVKVSRLRDAKSNEMMFKMQIYQSYDKLSPHIKKLVIQELNNRNVQIPKINSDVSLMDNLRTDGGNEDKIEAKKRANTFAGDYKTWKITSNYMPPKDKEKSFDTQFTRSFEKLSPNVKKLVIQELNTQNIKIPTIN
ncbi:MAG: hypothetical protein HQL46_10500 [Gammaproteobacteria bacterium]|nr:hypothetical protein [Gammaproteobacteria bacterium]